MILVPGFHVYVQKCICLGLFDDDLEVDCFWSWKYCCLRDIFLDIWQILIVARTQENGPEVYKVYTVYTHTHSFLHNPFDLCIDRKRPYVGRSNINSSIGVTMGHSGSLSIRIVNQTVGRLCSCFHHSLSPGQTVRSLSPRRRENHRRRQGGGRQG